MVPVGDTFYADLDNHPEVVMLVAEDTNTGDVLGVVTGVDHRLAFQDPDNGCSLWALAVDPQSHRPAVGMMLVQSLSYHFSQKGRRFMDLSVMHDNTYAISMYKKMGFRQVPVYCIKKKNSINEQLYIGPDLEDDLNVYAKIIIDEARRRGIGVNIQDAAEGFFELSHGGRTIACRESLSELTNAVSMSKCDNKLVTQRILTQHGLCVPAQHVYTSALELDSFLNTYPRVVVKPARGEQGKGISVDVSGKEEVLTAITAAQKHCETVIIEEFVSGDDLRVIVIDREVVAAAVRRAPRIIGTGQHSIENLIRHQSRRRMTATQGESQIPMDIETERCVRAHGYAMHDILPENETIIVRKTANLHTGGTIHDVTKDLHPELIAAAIAAADALSIPVVGLDFMTPDCSKPDYVIIEANERPGLANHEPQPTVERFIDLLFPQTRKLDEIPKG
jgi:GNAT-family acetyltransferase (TIGR03103 family)